ncbi:MAG TPA: UDP-N-acetylmuramoyl-L-alanine--D-glutamate ligase, partial [Methylomirabilota bacterium]|nr:UDP-N-acetylmuramoyl-L-alanine--D-glutamate ligase [Methylomirabilota bacterium]
MSVTDMATGVERGQAYREKVRDLNVTVVGLARSGVAACQLLIELGARVSATDAKPMEELSPSVRELGRIGVTLFLGGHPKEALYRSELVVVSPGVRSDLLLLGEARNRGIAVISEVELAWRV